MTESPRVSVMLPVYNGAPYLEAAVGSVLDQTYTNFELLALDDGSTDGSGTILARLSLKDSRLRVVSRKNRGLVATLNELMRLARGEYLARMDADDVCLPERFARQVTYLDAHPEVGIVGGRALYCDGGGQPIFTPALPQHHEEIDALNLIGRAALVHPSVMMRRSVLQDLGGYDARFESAEDLDLWLRAAEHVRLANLEESVIRYRMVETSMSGARRSEQRAIAARACQAAWQRRGLPPRKMVEGHWRPGKDRASRRDFALKWAWQAWNAGNQATARHFFLQALRLDPLSKAVWTGLAVSLLRRRRGT